MERKEANPIKCHSGLGNMPLVTLPTIPYIIFSVGYVKHVKKCLSTHCDMKGKINKKTDLNISL